MATEKSEVLNANNAALLLVDHQTGLLLCTQTMEHADLINNVVALAKLAKGFNIPTILTTSFSAGPNGPILPEITSLFPDATVIDRSIVNAWHDARFVDAVKKTGRKKLIIAGISTEVCTAFPALSAVKEGFQVYAVVDACVTWNRRVEEAAFHRMAQGGVVLTNWVSVAAELLGDWATESGGKVGGIFAEHFHSYRTLGAQSNR